MNAIDRPGTFRGKITEAGVTESTGGFPQFVGRFQATEFYDESTGEWTAWAEYEQEIVGYFVLYTKDKQSGQWKELLNAQQIKKALGWNGQSFTDLANGDYSETLVMFRVEASEYNGNTSLKVTWLDAADANPTRQLQKYDASKLSALDKNFAGVLSTKAPTPTSAKPASAKPVTPPKKPGRPAGSKSSPPSGAPAKASPTPAAPAPTATDAPKSECTKEEAWEEAVTNPVRDKDITDDKLGEAWLAEAAKIGKDEDKFSPADWATVRDAVVKATSKF